MRSTSLLYKILPTFYTFHTSHLRWNSTIYQTDLGQNAVFNNFSRQIHSVNVQDDQSCAFSETVQKISKITYTDGQPVLTLDRRQKCELWSSVWMNSYTSTQLRISMFIFLFNGFLTMCNLKKCLIRAAFWVFLQAMFMNDWKQTAERLKLQERLLTINKRNITRWNIYRDNNFHSRRQVLKQNPQGNWIILTFSGQKPCTSIT